MPAAHLHRASIVRVGIDAQAGLVWVALDDTSAKTPDVVGPCNVLEDAGRAGFAPGQRVIVALLHGRRENAVVVGRVV